MVEEWTPVAVLESLIWELEAAFPRKRRTKIAPAQIHALVSSLTPCKEVHCVVRRHVASATQGKAANSTVVIRAVIAAYDELVEAESRRRRP